MLTADELRTAWIVYVAAVIGGILCFGWLLPSGMGATRRLICVLLAVLFLTPVGVSFEQLEYWSPAVMAMIFSLFETGGDTLLKHLFPVVFNSVIAVLLLLISEWWWGRRKRTSTAENE